MSVAGEVSEGPPGPSGCEPTEIYHALTQAAEIRPDAVYVATDRQRALTFGGLAHAVRRCADQLAEAGVGAGDRVAIAAENGPSWVVVAFAAARLGAVLAPLSTRLVAREAAHHLTLVDARALVLQPAVRGRDLRREWHPERLVPVLTELPDVDGTFGAPLVAPVPAPRHSADAVLAGAAVMIGTSGTTGLPKCGVLGHEGLLWTARHVAARQGLGPGSRLLSVAPFFHASGYVHGLLACLVSGATLVTSARYEPERLLELAADPATTHYHGALLPEIALARRDTPLLAWCAGTDAEFRRAERQGCAVIGGIYGMTETSGCTSLTWWSDEQAARHGSSGMPLPGVEVRTVEPGTGVPVRPGESGELLVRGPHVMLGYFRDPEATAAAVDADGWLHTGDLGRLRPDGGLVWEGRLKDVLRVGGENVAAMEIEQVLLEYPGVAEAAVVGTVDDQLGEVPVAALVPAGGVRVGLDIEDVLLSRPGSCGGS
jgi:acyl-CoA synthetase (AMP-forming)/AMP-acid ligase II